MEDSDGVASVVSVTDSEEEEQKAKERFRDFVQKKGVLTQFPGFECRVLLVLLLVSKSQPEGFESRAVCFKGVFKVFLRISSRSDDFLKMCFALKKHHLL